MPDTHEGDSTPQVLIPGSGNGDRSLTETVDSRTREADYIAALLHGSNARGAVPPDDPLAQEALRRRLERYLGTHNGTGDADDSSLNRPDTDIPPAHVIVPEGTDASTYSQRIAPHETRAEERKSRRLQALVSPYHYLLSFASPAAQDILRPVCSEFEREQNRQRWYTELEKLLLS